MPTANQPAAPRRPRSSRQDGTPARLATASARASSALEAADATALTLESLALAAQALLASATGATDGERRQLARARARLAALPARAARAAACLDVPGSVTLATPADIGTARAALATLGEEVEAAIAALRAIDTHGETTGAGGAAIHADIVLGVLAGQLERAANHLARATRAARELA